jgi:hypothetical protein
MLDALRGVWNRRKAWLCALLALAPLSCASLEQGDASTITSIDLPVFGGPIAWMDNERILLRVDAGRRIDVPDGGQYATFDLISYNYKTGDRHNYGRVGQQICYADGYISHTRLDDEDNNVVIAVYGELGKESTRRVRRGEMLFEGGASGSCRPLSDLPKRPSWVSEKTTIWFLWPRLGFIDCRTNFVSPLAKHVKARFHRFDDSVGVALPYSCYQVRSYGTLRYYPYKNAYFSFEHDFNTPWPKGRDRRAFWLYPDGHVETLTFPYSQAIRHTATPVADGILAFAEPANRKDDYWVYYLTPRSSKQLFRGNAAGITSPDGCKVAMVIDPDFKAKAWSRDIETPVALKILDFCSGK